MDQAVDALGIRYATPEDLASDSQSILDWLAAEQLTHLAVHFDLDVLTPADFRSILPAQPHTAISDFGAAVGQMALRQIVRVMHDVSQQADIVGFSIAEHMPWDAINLRHALREIAIFK
jgi:arginase